jgi:hypothetical protein
VGADSRAEAVAARRADIEAQERAEQASGDGADQDALTASIDALRAKYRR